MRSFFTVKTFYRFLSKNGTIYSNASLTNGAKSYMSKWLASGMTCISLLLCGTALNTSVEASRLQAFSPVMTR